MKDWLCSTLKSILAHTNTLICGSSLHFNSPSSSQIPMTLTSQEFCKQLVMLVIVRVVCSEIKCHGAICVWICHSFHSPDYFRHTVIQQSQMMNTSKPGHHSRETGEFIFCLTWVFHVPGWWAAAPGWCHLTNPHPTCPAPEFLWNFLQFHTASTGPDCGMPVAASVMKAKPGALCNLQSPRRKNKRMHNPPASVSR